MALTVYLLHQPNQSRSRTIWVSNLGISFPGLAVELYLAFATWFAFCWMSCLHDQLTCFTNKFLATAYKLFLFFYLWQKKERKAQGTLPFWPVVQCQPLLFWPVVQCQPHGTRSMQSSLLLSSSQPYHYCESCSSYPVSSPLIVPSQPCFLFSTQLWGAETASRNISQPCGLLSTVRKHQHPSCLCRTPKCATVLDFGIFSPSHRAFTAEFIFKRSK